MSVETNKEFVKRFFHEAYTQKDLKAARDMLSRDYILNDSAIPNFSGGPETWEQIQIAFHQAFPDLRLTIEDIIAEGDFVVTRWMACGTQDGDLPGIPATGRHMLITGMTLSKIVNDKIEEQWQEWDRFGALQQLGVSGELMFMSE
ncbi:MAG: ester cyclase [Phycisphaerae bacterium]|jgi:steroid delta-isomerase-like uncharacterized protein|nr:ester cyclase [Phycisphaerae bacterium]